ncbi:glycosyltransferase family 2 protein [Donghicola mangrovi]|uniref:Glycosyltransferase family 2 protein n=1 Tax=Donghicola mangrovi TaxID=2729614 RepID=A0A850Q9J3_9RHOB|nr:glycosyltransferase family 2 protein [Donghicola mangrovi]NVO23155.1 glycosyltransferase family 2 protein [Donghicola mangrovi]
MRLLCVSTQRNEGPYLLEWVAHLRACGVTDLLIYSNDCDDGSDDLLDLLDGAGILTHVRHQVPEGESIQWTALKAAWKHPLRKEADWAIVCDVDEFPVIKVGTGQFADLINSVLGGFDAMVLPWRLFGANRVARLHDAPVTGQFRMAQRPDAMWPVAATFFKTLFRLDGPFNQFGVHRPRQKPEAKAGLPRIVDGSGRPLPEGFVRNTKRLSLFGLPTGRNLAEMNHYSLRSAEGFVIKRDRGLPNRTDKAIDLAYWTERNFNEVPEPAIDQIADRVAAERAKLEAIAGIPEAHQRALAWHRQRFADLVTTEAGHKLYSQLLLAQGSTTPDADTARQLVQWFQTAYKRGLEDAE